MSLQEKFQILVPYSKDEDDGNSWVDANKARVTRPVEKFNEMPTGYECEDEAARFTRGFGGDTDVSGGINPNSLDKGFQRRNMDGAEDLYSGENVDLFYGESVSEEGEVGFVERNNYLDRI